MPDDATDPGRAVRPRPVTLVVAVVTYRRLEPLRSLVPVLLDRMREAEVRHDVSCRLLVVDNDPGGSAAAAMTTLGNGRSSVVVEPTPGIPAARSRALREAATDQLLVFVDDDEIPEPGWLSALVECWTRCGAAAVSGPVRTVLPPGTDPFIAEGDFYARTHAAGWRTGDVIPVAATNNLLLDLAVVRRLGLDFDDRFRRTGGEDTAFTAGLTAAGERIVWCREATVVEHLLPERRTREVALSRAYSLANSRIVVSLALEPSRWRRGAVQLRGLGSALRFATRGAAATVDGRVRGDRAAYARGRRDLARARGTVDALRRLRAEPYARTSP